MLAVYILLGLLFLIVVILLMPVNLYLAFDETLTIRVRYAFFSYILYPQEEKKEQEKPNRQKSRKQAKKSVKKPPKKEGKEKEKIHPLASVADMFKEDGVSATLSYIMELVKLAGTEVKRVLRILVVDRLELELSIASEDAADTAVDYGKACGIVYPAQAVLETVFRIQKRHIQIYPDFTAQKGKALIFLKIHVLPLRISGAVVGIIFRYFVHTIRHRAADEALQTAAVKEKHAG